MLSHNIASKQANKDDDQTKSGGGSIGPKTFSLRPPEQKLKCPRCDSPNTKFCYYNNYSLAQPRHFCKACRRYWTKGGALRTVPIGGSCRKNKKTKSCSSRFFVGETSSKGSSSDIGGMKFYGVSTLDFQLGGLNFPPTVATNNQLSSSYGDTSSNPSFVSLDPLGFNFPFSSSHQQHNQNGGGLASFHDMSSTTNHVHHNTNDLASSIESLSFINQDLHWKLQQQRLSMLYGGGVENDQQPNKKQVVMESHAQKLQPILFQNLDTSKPAAQSSMDGDSRKDIGLETEWFFENSYVSTNQNPVTPTDSNSVRKDQNETMNNWNGIQGWNHLNQYTSIP